MSFKNRRNLNEYAQIMQSSIDEFTLPNKPDKLYESINYILSLGGKRLRPTMVLLAADACGEMTNDTKKLALVVELFHNFSLMHDDIMDNAELRRGMPSVHKKWNVPTAILGGDALLVKTYELLMTLESNNRDALIRLYTQTAIEVCEGQQMDMNFETQTQVSIEEYIEMIRLKTAVLMAAACKMGAISANANSQQQEAFYLFGQNLGIAFQIKDDYLDCFGSDVIGKRLGGDIIENKKTYLQIKALELGKSSKNLQLKELWNETDETKKVDDVKALFADTGAKVAAEDAMNDYYRKSLYFLAQAELPKDKEAYLAKFAENVWLRDK